LLTDSQSREGGVRCIGRIVSWGRVQRAESTERDVPLRQFLVGSWWEADAGERSVRTSRLSVTAD